MARSYYVTDNGEALKPLRQRQEKAETAFGAHATVQELEAKIVKVKADTSAIQQAQADKERHWAEQAARALRPKQLRSALAAVATTWARQGSTST